MIPGKYFIPKLPVILAILLLGSIGGQAQERDSVAVPMPELGPYDTIPVPAEIHDNQWIPVGNLEWFWVTAKYPKHLAKKKKEWNRLRNAVYVTYPYAKKAGIIMNEINMKLVNVSAKSQRKKIIRERERDLKREFTDPIQDLSVYQGRVLMKLINRQTGNNCYEIIKEYKGGVTARFWQTVAFVFGSNLKQPYDAIEQDKEIELIVQEIERMHWYGQTR